MTDTNALRDAALTYAARGWQIIPLHNIRSDGGCTCWKRNNCPHAGKHPRHDDWNNQGSTSAADIYAWWEDWPEANVGIVTNAAGRVWVLDIDPDKGGFDALTNLVGEYGQLPVTRIHATGSGGLHYVWAWPDDFDAPTTSGSLGAGIDTRGAGNGQIVAPPSVSGKGPYSVVRDIDPQPAPAWLLERLREVVEARRSAKEAPPVKGEPVDMDGLPHWLRTRLTALDVGDRSAYFFGTVAACRRAGLKQGQTVTALTYWCDLVDKYKGRVEAEVARSWGKLPDADPENRDLSDLIAPPKDSPPAERPGLEVTNAAVAADWLREAVGAGPLAGMFLRGPSIVHTPREGEDGYVELSDHDGDVDGPAQVRPVLSSTLASRVQYLYRCFRMSKEGKTSPAMFPTSAARVACDVPDMLPNLRMLRGVVHSPIIRRDGTILTTPGYDSASKLLYLPEPGLDVPDVPERPTPAQVAAAVALLDEMTGDFDFLTEHDRANYYGLLVTPLLRVLVPPPYKLGGIGAPQPGSGKTLLANILRIVHGGVFRSEMPGDDTELGKQITAILTVTTGPVVHFDNVAGVLRSSKLAGLLTSRQWDDRPLGVTEWTSHVNDRLWIVTGNNLSLGGDLPRRALWVTIDPAIPDPHLRTVFKIPNLEEWARQRRSALLHALLTLVRAWVAQGMPTTPRGGDGYARWIEAVDGILTVAGVSGTFAHSDSARQTIGTDDEEWHEFLAAVFRVFGDQPWTVRDMLDKVDVSTSVPTEVWAIDHPIPLEALPADLADKALRSASGVRGIARSLGMWLRNRDGRWAQRLTVRSAGKDRKDAGLWRVEEAKSAGTTKSAGTSPGKPNASTSGNIQSAGTAGTISNPKTFKSGISKSVPGSVGISPGSPGSPGTSPACGGCGWPLDSAGHEAGCGVAV